VISCVHPSTRRWILSEKRAHVLLWFRGALQTHQTTLRHATQAGGGDIQRHFALEEEVGDGRDGERKANVAGLASSASRAIFPLLISFPALTTTHTTRAVAHPPPTNVCRRATTILGDGLYSRGLSLPAANMPNSFGYRARTRDMFKRNFKGALDLGLYTVLLLDAQT
jgi:hypothetical protein